jgi:yeast amino acid transporter
MSLPTTKSVSIADDKKPWTPQSSSSSKNSKIDMDFEAHDNVKRLRTRVIDSFRRDPAASVTRNTSIHSNDDHRKPFDMESAAQATANSPLLRSLKGRHLQMIAIGGSIGTGLFVGSGKALSHGGPASLVIAFSLIGVMMYCTVQALGEMAVSFPVAGSFAAYSTRCTYPPHRPVSAARVSQ